MEKFWKGITVATWLSRWHKPKERHYTCKKKSFGHHFEQITHFLYVYHTDMRSFISMSKCFFVFSLQEIVNVIFLHKFFAHLFLIFSKYIESSKIFRGLHLNLTDVIGRPSEKAVNSKKGGRYLLALLFYISIFSHIGMRNYTVISFKQWFLIIIYSES